MSSFVRSILGRHIGFLHVTSLRFDTDLLLPNAPSLAHIPCYEARDNDHDDHRPPRPTG